MSNSSTRRIRVPSAPELYPFIETWIQALPASTALHATALHALAHLVTALLVGQSLRPTALMRAFASPLPVPARQRYKRVARAWTRPWLSPAWLVPRLVPAALALVPGGGLSAHGGSHPCSLGGAPAEDLVRRQTSSPSGPEAVLAAAGGRARDACV